MEGRNGGLELRWTVDRRSMRLSCGTRDETEARRFLAAWLLNEGRTVDPQRMTVAAVLDSYAAEHVGPHCLAADRQGFAITNLKAGMGGVEVTELTAMRVLTYNGARAKGLTGRPVCESTVRRELSVLCAAIKHAIAQRRLAADAVPMIALPPAAPPRDVWLTESELAAFTSFAGCWSETLPPRIARFVAIASETASRKNAVVRLKWSQVDFCAALLNFQTDGNRQTTKRRVPAPMSAKLSEAMLRWRVQLPGEGFVLDSPFTIQHQWDALCVRAAEALGIEKLYSITPHTLRHTWATLAARRAVDLWMIAGVLGDTLATVSRNYLHHCPDHLRAAVA